MRDRARDVDAFVATCDWYADSMAAYLQAPRDRVRVVRLGVSLEGHGPWRPDGAGEAVYHRVSGPYRTGEGLAPAGGCRGRLADEVGRENLRLRVAGYLGGREKTYFRQVTSLIESRGLSDVFEYRGEVDRKQKIEFLRSVHVLSVPTPYLEPKGLFVLEALASGTPVVQPRHGAFPELVERTGGGILVDPESPAALAAGLFSPDEGQGDPGGHGEKGQGGRPAGTSATRAMAGAMQDVYRQFVAG